jgi:hypothetical protein
MTHPGAVDFEKKVKIKDLLAKIGALTMDRDI